MIVSLSMILTVAVLCPPTKPVPFGAVRITVNVRVGSVVGSSIIGIWMTFETSPTAKVTLPTLDSVITPAMAVPSFVA